MISTPKVGIYWLNVERAKWVLKNFESRGDDLPTHTWTNKQECSSYDEWQPVDVANNTWQRFRSSVGSSRFRRDQGARLSASVE